MCGIIAYIGKRNASEVLIKGLKRLEYRGYDSAGIAISNDDKIEIYKCKGKVEDLEKIINSKNIEANVGIGHTRWATHGVPSDENAHPHQSMNGYFTVIHNGIIENYNELKRFLLDRNYHFKGETDTEILANLFEYLYLENKSIYPDFSPIVAIKTVLHGIIVAYGLTIMCSDCPNQIIAARKGSPLVLCFQRG